MWWGNAEQRKRNKEKIKNMIKHTKLQEKAAQQNQMQVTVSTPPGLCHSIPTSDTYSERTTRQASVESTFSPEFAFGHHHGFSAAAAAAAAAAHHDHFGSAIMPPPQFVPSMSTPFVASGDFSPYEVDIKTEYQTFVNDVETRRDSTLSTFSTFPLPGQPGFADDAWVQQDHFEGLSESFTEEPLNFDFFDFQHPQLSPQHSSLIQVDDSDQYLLQHFMTAVVPLLFPVLETNQHGSARNDIILPALESNPTYLSCCLSAAALHYKTTTGAHGDKIDGDIMRHRLETVQQLCSALSGAAEHDQALEATLAIILFQCAVGRHNDDLKDIAWHQHFDSAKDLINQLDLPTRMLSAQSSQHPHFNMTLAAWIDILGATMNGRMPLYADTYREKLAAGSMGLAELMGCEDKIMFFISEIACLEAVKSDASMDEVQLCAYIRMLGEQISLTEQTAGPLDNVYKGTGAIRPRQLSKNITAVFRTAARIYLCSLVPDFDRSGAHIVNLVNALAEAMDFIPSGPQGYDRSLVWPLLVAGSASMSDSPFRAMFAERSKQLGQAAGFGAFSHLAELLKAVWAVNDKRQAEGEVQRCFHWREAMAQNGWDFLLI